MGLLQPGPGVQGVGAGTQPDKRAAGEAGRCPVGGGSMQRPSVSLTSGHRGTSVPATRQEVGVGTQAELNFSSL